MDTREKETINRWYYIGLFALFGFVIAFFTALLSYRLDTLSMEKKLKVSAENTFDQKVEEFEEFTSGLEYVVRALRDSSLLYQYLDAPTAEHYDHLAASYRTVANSNPSLMQV